MTLSFEPPKVPNGIITHYKAFYNKTDGQSREKTFRTKDLHKEKMLSIKLTDYMSYYSNYSIELVACVEEACSEKSKPVYAFTSISCKFFFSQFCRILFVFNWAFMFDWTFFPQCRKYSVFFKWHLLTILLPAFYLLVYSDILKDCIFNNM